MSVTAAEKQAVMAQQHPQELQGEVCRVTWNGREWVLDVVKDAAGFSEIVGVKFDGRWEYAADTLTALLLLSLYDAMERDDREESDRQAQADAENGCEVTEVWL